MAGDWRLYLEALALPGAKVAYEAEPLNVHRRHATSVTHALDADRHVDEIARCHVVVRQAFAPPVWVCANQEAYAREVAQESIQNPGGDYAATDQFDHRWQTESLGSDGGRHPRVRHSVPLAFVPRSLWLSSRFGTERVHLSGLSPVNGRKISFRLSDKPRNTTRSASVVAPTLWLFGCSFNTAQLFARKECMLGSKI